MANMEQLAAVLAGRFVVIDGPDGAGKGTQIELLARSIRGAGIECATVRDPGDTAAGDMIRQILLHSRTRLETATEVLLFMASRAQLVVEKIRPALAAGSAVLCDRFISATCAYQGASGAAINEIVAVGRFAVGNTWPELTIVLDVQADAGLERIANGRGTAADAMESRSIEFHNRVRQIFLSLPGGVYPGSVRIVDGSGSVEQVNGRILAVLEEFAAGRT